MPQVFDPALRKTVSCPVLEAAFAKNPHPDGKTMHALAEKLKLNKKQVSNFFERERRKANIVIESRRKGGNSGGGSSGNSSSSNSGSVNGSAVKASYNSNKKTKNTASPAYDVKRATGKDATDKTFSPSSAAAITLQKQLDDESKALDLSNKRTTRRAVKQASYFDDDADDDVEDVLDDEEYGEGEGNNEDDEDAEGEDYEDDAAEYAEDSGTSLAKPTKVAVAADQVEVDITIELQQQQQQNPLVQKNKIESSLARSSTGGLTSSRYASRNARYASRSPLYASPAAQTWDNFRTAPSAVALPSQPIMRRTVSASPSILSRSSSPLTAGTRHALQTTLLTAFGTSSKNLAAPPSMHVLKHGSRASSLVDEETSSFGLGGGGGKRKRGNLPSESPTVMFLRNPFPAPLPPQTSTSVDSLRPEFARASSVQSANSMMADEEFQNHLNEEVADFTLDPYQPMMRKRARVWFSKPGGTEGDSADLSSESTHNLSSQESAKSRSTRTAGEVTQTNINATRTARSSTIKRLDNKNQSSDANRKDDEDDDMDSSDASDYGDEGLDMSKTKKRDNRPGAALRTNIACTELRQAFVTNPHPAAHVLEALAARLGLGKKQVSNYFVRERKKAGFTIKVRHGLHRRRGPNKKKLDRPAVVVTQHDMDSSADPSQLLPSSSQVAEDRDLSVMTGYDEEEEEESDDDASNTGSQMDGMAIDTDINIDPSLLGNKDDVPDLSYDDQDSASTLRNAFPGHDDGSNNNTMSSLMVASKSMESMTTSSRLDEDEELASPPFEAVHLPPTNEVGKVASGLPEQLFSYGAHVLPADSSLQYT